VVASGGADGPEHMLQALLAGADAALAASIFHDNRFTIGEVKAHLAQRSVRIRP
jgi:cyclase